MCYSKHKDLPPEETLKRINDILLPIGIDLNHIVHKRMDGIYSSLVYDSYNWWSTAGKGTTIEYCLASGYAEAVEHLCSYCAYNYNEVNNTAKAFGGFKRYPDEIPCSIREAITLNKAVYNDIINSFENDGSVFSLEKCEECWSKVLGEDKAMLVPYFNVKEERITYLPDEIIGRLCGSTGGGAGNSPYEAISHAFDEICERYAKYIIYSKELSPPTISRNFIKENCKEIFDIIKSVEAIGYKVIVKDASLGESFPVVAVLLINPKEQSYMVKFGAHCCLNIALERCFTEMFQFFSVNSEAGNGHKKLHHWTEVDDLESKLESNWFSQLKDDTGAVPTKFFLDKESWHFKPWGININYTNKKGVKFHLENFKRLGFDNIFIRDLSFIGFPVYKVYIPSVSNSHFSINDKVLEEFIVSYDIIQNIQKNSQLSIEDNYSILLNAFNKDSFLGGMILKNVEEELLDVCYAAILFERDRDIRALKRIPKTNKYARSILMNFKLADEGYTKEERESIFSKLVDPQVFEIIKCWMEDNIFAKLILCFKNNFKTESQDIPWKKYDNCKISDTHINLKMMLSEHVPNQMDILSLINDS